MSQILRKYYKINVSYKRAWTESNFQKLKLPFSRISFLSSFERLLFIIIKTVLHGLISVRGKYPWISRRLSILLMQQILRTKIESTAATILIFLKSA